MCLSLVVYFLYVGVTQTSAQNITFTNYQKLLAAKKVSSNCEENSAILNGIHQNAGDTGIIVVISRLGNGERQEFHNRRLHNIKFYLTNFYKRNPKTVLLAKGESVNDYGRVELYTGDFFDLIRVSKDRDLRVGICTFEQYEEPCSNKLEGKLYPCLLKNRLKVKNEKGRKKL